MKITYTSTYGNSKTLIVESKGSDNYKGEDGRNYTVFAGNLISQSETGKLRTIGQIDFIK